MLRIYNLLFLTTILISSCYREYAVDNSDNDFAIKLKVTKNDNTSVLEWSPVKNSAFKKYILVSSNSDLASGQKPIQNLIVKEIFSQDINTYEDNTISLSPKRFYKLYVDLGDRFLESNSISYTNDVFEMNGRSNIFALDKDSLTLLLSQNNTQSISYFDIKSREEISNNNQIQGLFSNTIIPTSIIKTHPRRVVIFNNFNSQVINLPALNSSQISSLNISNTFSADNNGKYLVVTHNSSGTSLNGQTIIEISNNFVIKQTNTREFPSDLRRVAFVSNDKVVEIASNYGYSYGLSSSGNVTNFKKHVLSKTNPVLPNIILSKDKSLFIGTVNGTIYNQNFETILERKCTNCSTFAISDDNQYLFEVTKRDNNNISEIKKYSIKDNKFINSIQFRDFINILEIIPTSNDVGVFYDRLNGRVNFQKIAI